MKVWTFAWTNTDDGETCESGAERMIDQTPAAAWRERVDAEHEAQEFGSHE